MWLVMTLAERFKKSQIEIVLKLLVTDVRCDLLKQKKKKMRVIAEFASAIFVCACVCVVRAVQHLQSIQPPPLYTKLLC